MYSGLPLWNTEGGDISMYYKEVSATYNLIKVTDPILCRLKLFHYFRVIHRRSVKKFVLRNSIYILLLKSLIAQKKQHTELVYTNIIYKDNYIFLDHINVLKF